MNKYYPVGFVIGSSNEMPVDLVILHLKAIGGVLKEDK